MRFGWNRACERAFAAFYAMLERREARVAGREAREHLDEWACSVGIIWIVEMETSRLDERVSEHRPAPPLEREQHVVCPGRSIEITEAHPNSGQRARQRGIGRCVTERAYEALLGGRRLARPGEELRRAV